MKFKSFFLRNHMKFYGIICLVANVLAVFSSGISSFVMLDTEACAVQQEFIASHPFLLKGLGSVVAYGLPALLCVLYGVKRYGMELKGYTDFAFALILLSLGLVQGIWKGSACIAEYGSPAGRLPCLGGRGRHTGAQGEGTPVCG